MIDPKYRKPPVVGSKDASKPATWAEREKQRLHLGEPKPGLSSNGQNQNSQTDDNKKPSRQIGQGVFAPKYIAPERKESVIKRYLKHPGIWINALLGRPNIPVYLDPDLQQFADTEVIGASSTMPIPALGESVPNTEDPIAHDLARVKSVFSQVSNNVGDKFKGDQNNQIEQALKKNRFKKFLPFVGVFLILLIIIAVGVSILDRRLVNPTQTSTPTVSQASPTPQEFIPQTEPSIYANDAEVQKLDEETRVLDGEVTRLQLRESTLNPPILDFNVNFK